MIRTTISFILCFFAISVFAQINEDFNDGNFTSDPAWSGNTTLFSIEDQMLRLTDSQPGEAYLSTPSKLVEQTQWEFWIRLAFTPSDNNHPRIYLVSDSQDLLAPLNGYFVQLGKTGTGNKRLYFYRQTGSDTEEIMVGNDEIVSGSNNRVKIKVTRDNQGTWEFFADPQGGELFLPQGTTTDSNHDATQWFGWVCRYTVSNANRFYLDDVYAGEIIVDETPPELVQVLPQNNNTLEISFSEPVEQTSAENTAHYFVDQGIGQPLSALRPDNQPDKVILTFDSEFVSGTSYEITIQNISDFTGNILSYATTGFVWYVPVPFDVVFNELMPDPTPQAGLPPHEYIELFNTSPFPINLKGWNLQHGPTQRELPEVIIPPGEYLILTTTSAAPEFEAFGQVAGVPSLSATALTNAGNTLILYDQDFQIISWVRYFDSWINDPEKTDGGWSIEKTDPLNFCGQQSNWQVSKDPSGGTPGTVNSVHDENTDITPPKLLGAVYENELQVTLFFSETMDREALLNPENYTLNNGLNSPLSVSSIEPYMQQATLTLGSPALPDQVYQINMNTNLKDCAGNPVENSSMLFTGRKPEQFDVVFNELMADPSPPVELPEIKYIEFFNTSEFPVVLLNWTLTHGTTDRTLPFIYLPPLGYAIITTEEGAPALKDFPNVHGVPGLSSTFLTLGGQRLVLSDPGGNNIAWVEYDNSWYGDDFKQEGGWALEKIDPWNYCGEGENWTSSKSSTGGTPGRQNSVYAQNPDEKAPILLRSGYVSPDQLILYFDETMDIQTLTEPENYNIDQGMGIPVDVTLLPDNFKEVLLTLPEPAVEGTIHQVSANGQLTDCAGNAMLPTDVRWGIPQEPDSAGMVINEILFIPQQNGERYVELYNRSPNITDLQRYILASEDPLSGEMESIREISADSHLFFPGEYRLLTPDTSTVLNLYMTQNRRGFLQTDLPSMTNSGGVLILSSKGRQIQERIEYKEEMHYALLTDPKGVALERINFELPGNEASNWLSASHSVGFGTPAFQNSQFTSKLSSQNAKLEIYPEIFSPDNDGHNDVLNISYKMTKPGFTAHVSIYDTRGRLVKILERNILLATEGVLIWDGTTKENLKANIGIYVIFMEIFDDQGNVESLKKIAVLGGRMP